MIYSASSQINGIELSTSRVVNLVSSLRGAVAVDVHVREKTIYWSDVRPHKQYVIKRMRLSSRNVEDIITVDLGVVEGLAVEWESNLIYWTDFSKGRVEVASLDGSRRKLLFVDDVSKPRGIALYPKKGLVALNISVGTDIFLISIALQVRCLIVIKKGYRKSTAKS